MPHQLAVSWEWDAHGVSPSSSVGLSIVQALGLFWLIPDIRPEPVEAGEGHRQRCTMAILSTAAL